MCIVKFRTVTSTLFYPSKYTDCQRASSLHNACAAPPAELIVCSRSRKCQAGDSVIRHTVPLPGHARGARAKNSTAALLCHRLDSAIVVSLLDARIVGGPAVHSVSAEGQAVRVALALRRAVSRGLVVARLKSGRERGCELRPSVAPAIAKSDAAGPACCRASTSAVTS